MTGAFTPSSTERTLAASFPVPDVEDILSIVGENFEFQSQVIGRLDF